jgi:hypothetical protein
MLFYQAIESFYCLKARLFMPKNEVYKINPTPITPFSLGGGQLFKSAEDSKKPFKKKDDSSLKSRDQKLGEGREDIGRREKKNGEGKQQKNFGISDDREGTVGRLQVTTKKQKKQNFCYPLSPNVKLRTQSLFFVSLRVVLKNDRGR